MNDEVFARAQTTRDFLHLQGPLEPADCIVWLGNYDLRVAGHLGNWTRAFWDRSEAEIFDEQAPLAPWA